MSIILGEVQFLDMKRVWNDPDLYDEFKLDADEIAFIESMIKEMP